MPFFCSPEVDPWKRIIGVHGVWLRFFGYRQSVLMFFVEVRAKWRPCRQSTSFLEARLRSDSYLKTHLSKTMKTPACQIPFDRMSGENESVNEA